MSGHFIRHRSSSLRTKMANHKTKIAYKKSCRHDDKVCKLKKKEMGKPHALLVPYPAQGHVIPMLELSLRLVRHGIKVTFANTEFNHRRLQKSLSESDVNIQQLVDMVSIPDGMEPWEDRSDIGRLAQLLFKVMPGELEALIDRIQGDKLTCVIADCTMVGALEVAEKLGIRRATFCTASAAGLVLSLNIPKLVSDGVIDGNGRPLENQVIQLSPTTPVMNSTKLLWSCVGDEATQKIIFGIFEKINHAVKMNDWLICNSSPDLEPGAFSLYTDIVVPVGPLLASNRLAKSVGHFWPEDSACLAWLDQQPPESVVYIAFGSFTVFDQTQFQELAVGLELTNRPFLWVVRQDITTDTDNAYPKGFKERVQNRWRMVGWAPQQQALSHPSAACFISHCGWNSTIEGICNGVPFLCWPYFSDQFLNQTYICEEWKVGLGFSKDDSGIIKKGEIKDKIEHLLSDKSYKERALNLRAKVMDSVTRGSSHKNFHAFVEWIKDN